ncbi:glycoside hydrolase family 1 protein (macronuclear) [Tetrahymena thermophila SB210]|uniref:Glycoside hydrolase family 1 protein n=1 Tax=Tetrahymena thermophila (strain SB210) TaxID=312017 RepID=Q240W3_TETTS|nr:glycoside hydrolase family 1 protein [Tetrahymena thermophila SB210]EAS02301.2 glycoside hydrolase family 1 protein [Tetrahymena thermophila SB210]|eukprot:XP_001022546.2 glycoside hydrolase family 1 protein [Tetrahymena thermophila SB210]
MASENKLYDHFMLTYQILYLLVEDQEQNLLYPLIQKFAEKPKYIEESETEFGFTESYYLQIFSNQCLFDQTPILNIIKQFNQSKTILSLNESEQTTIDFAVENTIKQILLFYKEEINYFSELKNYVRRYIQVDEQNLEKYLENVLSINKETDKFCLKINNQNQTNYFNLGRSFCNMSNIQSDQLVIFQGSIRHELLDNLFEFQQQLLIKFFSDSWLLKQFIQRIELEANNDSFSSIIPYLHSYVLVFDYIISLSGKNSKLFNKKQLEEVQTIQQILYNKDNFDMIIKAMQKVLLDLSKEEDNKQQIQQITQTLNNYQNQFNKQSQTIEESAQPKQNSNEHSTENIQDSKHSENALVNEQFLISFSDSNLINTQNNQC